MPITLRASSAGYSFNREKTIELFEELLEQNILILPEVKHPDEVSQTNNPKYCPYHWLISHSTEDYFVLKGKFRILSTVGAYLF